MALNTAIICVGARRDRQGIRAARFIEQKLAARGHDVTHVDTQTCRLPMLDLMFRES